jgi:hypothetical protein
MSLERYFIILIGHVSYHVWHRSVGGEAEQIGEGADVAAGGVGFVEDPVAADDLAAGTRTPIAAAAAGTSSGRSTPFGVTPRPCAAPVAEQSPHCGPEPACPRDRVDHASVIAPDSRSGSSPCSAASRVGWTLEGAALLSWRFPPPALDLRSFIRMRQVVPSMTPSVSQYGLRKCHQCAILAPWT